MEYIVDGYNVIKQLPQYTVTKLKKGREGLIKFLEQKRPQGSLKNKVTVVFDGKDDEEDSFLPRWVIAKHNIEIMFSQGEIADDKIKKIIKSSRNPGNMYVVTNDRELRQAVKIYGAKPLYVHDFIRPILEKMRINSREFRKKLSYREQTKITEEMEKIWLR